jgi:cytochrome c oxidase assembly protein subunit 15
MRLLRALSLAACALAFVVVVAGAYVRLSDAGLGCPDWPLCYGEPLPPEIADRDLLVKAWKEMGHRYAAALLGVLILCIAVLAWRLHQSRVLAASIFALVVFQATLGAWTVTLLLKPAIVTAHLLGGMAILGALTWFALEQYSPERQFPSRPSRGAAGAALAVLAIQIALGGWVSSNYAALACPDLPLCLGEALPPMDFGNAFHVLRELGKTDEGALLPREALTAIHWTHRMFALVVVGFVGFAAVVALRFSKHLAFAIAALLALQFSLGVANVAFGLPLALAAAHNAVAALLLLTIVVLNFFAFRGSRTASSSSGFA